MYYDKKAFHSNEVYKSVIEVENQGTTYIDAKTQQAEARRLQEKAEEEANKPWYEKTWDGVCNFTGEVTGYYDYKRATEGVDPVTEEKLSTAERVTAGAMVSLPDSYQSSAGQARPSKAEKPSTKPEKRLSPLNTH